MIHFRTVTVVEGPEIDAWQQRQDALELAEDEGDAIRWQVAYQLLATVPSETQRGAIPMELLS